MRAYIQNKEGQPTNANTFNAREGFRLLGVSTVDFEAAALETLPLSPATIVCGYVGVVHRALELIGAPRPHFHPAPAALNSWFGRSIRETTLGEVRAMTEPIFVKPLFQHKEFTGYVRRGDLDDSSRTAHLDDDFAVLVSDVVRFLSEWRCFVIGGRCVGARPYAGELLPSTPDWSVLDPIITKLGPAAPAAYSVDLGVTDRGQTLIVELNDAYALASYGLPAVPYAQLLEARWIELVASRTEPPGSSFTARRPSR
jgi:hypothetical protein